MSADPPGNPEVPEVLANPTNPASPVIRVLLADDQAIVRTGMAMILSAEDDIEVVAHAHDGLHAVEQAAAHRPDVILMDIRMPRLDGLDALRLINRPGTVSPRRSSSSPPSTTTPISPGPSRRAPAASSSRTRVPACSPRRYVPPPPATPS